MSGPRKSGGLPARSSVISRVPWMIGLRALNAFQGGAQRIDIAGRYFRPALQATETAGCGCDDRNAACDRRDQYA